MKADLVCVGNELLTGLIENSHAGYLSRHLWSAGISVRESSVVADDQEAISSALKRAFHHSDIVIITGGLGPTDDDLTRESLASILGLPLVLDEEWLEKLKGFFAKRGYKMPESNCKQAMIIEGSTLLDNPGGTAPGLILEREGKLIIMLPGPTNEMQVIFEQSVLPFLIKRNQGKVSRLKTLKCVGLGESRLEEKIKSLGNWDLPQLSYVAKGYEVHLQIKGEGDEAEAAASIEKAEKLLRGTLGDHIYGCNDDTLACRVAALIKNTPNTLSLAESCSGGLLSDMITDIPGSSEFYKGGLVTYTIDAKVDLLDLDREYIETVGEVSEETARAMAEAVRRVMDTYYGIGITGVAGPGNNADEQPAGLVYVAISSPEHCQCKELNLGGGRRMVKERAAVMALDMLRRSLLSL